MLNRSLKPELGSLGSVMKEEISLKFIIICHLMSSIAKGLTLNQGAPAGRLRRDSIGIRGGKKIDLDLLFTVT